MGVSNQKIICLVGPSGSGKTTIAKELEKEGYNIIHSYTTRKPRVTNEWGHIFVDEGYMSKDFILEINWDGSKFIPKGNVIAYLNAYNNHYWATREQYRGKGISIYVVDPVGAKEVQENVKDAEVLTIFLMVDVEDRYYRLKKSREKQEVYARVKKDNEIFKVCKCDYVVDANRYIGQVVLDILEIIERF